MEGKNPLLKTPTNGNTKPSLWSPHGQFLPWMWKKDTLWTTYLLRAYLLHTLKSKLTKSRIGKSLSWILGTPSGILITKAGKTLCSILIWLALDGITRCWLVSSIFQIVQILVHSHFDLVSWFLALEATEPVSEPVSQMAVELINIHLISVQQKRWV